MTETQKFYTEHCWTDAPLFHQPWWLNAVCGDEWDVAVVKDANQLKAYYLYAIQKNKFGTQIVMPPLTQFLGPNYKLTSTGTRERNNEETEVLESLLKQLPSFASFESRWHHSFQNWLPFHWNQFQQRTRYTYAFDDISNPELLKENFSEKIIREINKSSKVFSVNEADDANEFYNLIKKNFEEKKAKVSLNAKILQTVFEACRIHNAGKILLAKDESGKVAAGIFVAWDSTTAYYIIGGKNSEFGNSGAMSMLFWHVINELKDKVTCFDFEGSMIKGVEQYFRSFGAKQNGFFEITKINSPVLKIKQAAKNIFQKR